MLAVEVQLRQQHGAFPLLVRVIPGERRLILEAELDASSAIGQPILGVEDLDVAVFILFELNGGAST